MKMKLDIYELTALCLATAIVGGLVSIGIAIGIVIGYVIFK